MYPISRTQNLWWVLALAGVVSILFGLTALFWPGVTLAVFIYLFGIYAIVYGFVELGHMFRSTETTAWWTHLLVGVLSILAGIAAFAWPGQTALMLLYIIAAWAISVGIVETVAAFFLNQLHLALGGLVSVLFGFVLLANPGVGALALIVVIGVFAIVRGIILIAASFMPSTAPAVRS
ncbi:MAG: HdeD family acid-resistance protein [Chloroflexi bacterium]|nr:HdeD family acid-resistance protein [Chloroflexota bacterium]